RGAGGGGDLGREPVDREARAHEDAREREIRGHQHEDPAQAAAREEREGRGDRLAQVVGSNEETVKVTSSRSTLSAPAAERVRTRRLFTDSGCGADSILCRKFTTCASVTCLSCTCTLVSRYASLAAAA